MRKGLTFLWEWRESVLLGLWGSWPLTFKDSLPEKVFPTEKQNMRTALTGSREKKVKLGENLPDSG